MFSNIKTTVPHLLLLPMLLLLPTHGHDVLHHLRRRAVYDEPRPRRRRRDRGRPWPPVRLLVSQLPLLLQPGLVQQVLLPLGLKAGDLTGEVVAPALDLLSVQEGQISLRGLL